MSKQCCICGTVIGFMTANKRFYNGKSFDICTSCQDAFAKVNSSNTSKANSGLDYLRTKKAEGLIAPEAITMVDDALGETNNAKYTTNAQRRNNAATVGNGVPFFAGVVFLVIAAILYYVSVNNNYGVANIQSSVFSAASFVAAVVCFATARIIDAINFRR